MISKKDFIAQATRYLKNTKDGHTFIRKVFLHFCYVALSLTAVCLFAFILSSFNIITKETSFLIFVGTFLSICLIGGSMALVAAFLFLFFQNKKINTRTISTFSKIFNLLSIQVSNKALDTPQELIDLYTKQDQSYRKCLFPSYSFISQRIQWMNFYIQSKNLYNASFITMEAQIPVDGNIIAVPSFKDADDKIDMSAYYPVHYKGKLFNQLKFYATKPNQSLDFLTLDFEKNLSAFLNNAFLTKNGIGTNFIYLKLNSNGISLFIPDGPFIFDFSIKREYKKGKGSVITENQRLFTDYGDLESLYKTGTDIASLNQAILKMMY